MDPLVIFLAYMAVGALLAWWDAPHAIVNAIDTVYETNDPDDVNRSKYHARLFWDIVLWPLTAPMRLAQNRGRAQLVEIKRLELENRAKAVRVYELEQEIAQLSEEQDSQ